jgi:hypothetical protein
MAVTSELNTKPRPTLRHYLGTVLVALVCFCLVFFNIIAFVSIPTIQWQDLGLIIPMTVWPICIVLSLVCGGVYFQQHKLKQKLPSSTYAIRVSLLFIALLSTGVVAISSFVMLFPWYSLSL